MVIKLVLIVNFHTQYVEALNSLKELGRNAIDKSEHNIQIIVVALKPLFHIVINLT